MVLASTWLTKIRSTNWSHQLWAVIYPINGDGSELVEEYIEQLSIEPFTPIEAFFKEETKHYEIPIDEPLAVHLAATINELPPIPPLDRQPLKVMWWSLKLRYWVFRHNNFDGPANIKLFVIYHTPEKNKRLAHSLGLQKGLIGIVHGFADKAYEGRNNVVITHEMLHTLGATDKYDFATGQPIHPDGYAEPERQPLHPQEIAEIMGASIPLSDAKSQMPDTLDEALVGPKTAREINWMKNTEK